MYNILTSIITERTFFRQQQHSTNRTKRMEKSVIWLERSVVDQQDVTGEQSFQL